MKISFGSKIIEGPWGGGNLFLVNLKNYLINNNHNVVFNLNDKDIDPPFQPLIYLLIMVFIVVNIGLIGFILTFSIMALIVLISTLKIFDFPYITRKIKLLCSYLNAEKK